LEEVAPRGRRTTRWVATWDISFWSKN